MNAPAAAILEDGLRARGLLPADAVPLPTDETGRPWFVSLLLGFSGWLAGLFGLVFLGLLFQPEHAPAFAVMGALLLAGAFGLYRTASNAFAEQLALAVSIAGHVAITAAVGIATESPGGTAFAVAALQAAWVAVVPNRMARTLATLIGGIAWALSVRFAFWGEDLGTGRRDQVALGPALLGWVVVWGPVAFAAAALRASEVGWMAAGRARLARPVLVGLLLALGWGTLASEPVQGLLFWEPAGPVRTNWLALWPLLSTGGSILALALAHALRSRPLMGSALAAALLHVFHFYLLVGTTLLVKAAIMAVVGALLVAGALLLERRGRVA
jgi:hypothetical protein